MTSTLLFMANGTSILWAFFILLFTVSYFVGVKLQNIYKERGK
jgi:F0F1-type ATP synthase membrane subunit b/b'